jgi:hypothetical protein
MSRSALHGTLAARVPAIGVAIAFFLVAGSAHAQQGSTAIVVGVVQDQSHAAIPGATVTLAHLDTTTTTEVITDERGQYRTPPLRIGRYEVNIELQGFRRFQQKDVVLNIGDVRTVNASLELGELSEQITVSASVPLLSMADSTVGTVITNQQIKDLPLNGRDYLQLAALSSGTGPSNGVGISVGGQNGAQVAFLLDGQDNNNQQIAIRDQKEVIKPSVDAIQEFKVVTNGYSAEYGRSSSGVVSVALKSGTNTLSGAVYDFFRDDALDAKDFFATEKQPFRRNQYGSAVGFPLLVNKTFFFGDFEVGTIRNSSPTISTLPSAALRAGQFASTVRDPLTGLPFPGNQIPASRIDPIAAKVLGFVPLPQTGAAANNFIYNSPRNQDARKGDVRVDQVLSGNQNLYVRYSYQGTEDGLSPPLPPDAQGNIYTGGGAETSTSKAWVGVHNQVWSPKLLSSIRVGANSIAWASEIPDQALRGIGIPGVAEVEPGFSQVQITGYPSWGVTNTPNYDTSRNRQVSGDITWSQGTHTVKTGVQLNWLETSFLSSQRSSGRFNFNGQYTGNPFGDFLLGYASGASLSKWAELEFASRYTHFFVQDDWRITPRLTINAGVRYELSPPPLEANDRIVNFDMDTDPLHPRLVVAGEEGNDYASRALQAVNYKQIAPRVGFAYSLPGEKTVVRGGWGVFYSNMITVGGMSSMEINPPNHLRIELSTDRAVPSIFLNQGFAANALTPQFARNVTLVSQDRSDKIPTAQQWNVNVQRELPGAVVIDIGYNGNRLYNDWRSIDGNPAPPGAGDINARRQFTSTLVPGTTDAITLANVVRIQKDGWLRYHGLQTKIEKRYSKGVSVLGAYTWSKTVGVSYPPGGANNVYQTPLDLEAEEAVAENDRRHYFVASGIYEIPFGRDTTQAASGGKRIALAVLGGWSISPILSISSGAPLNLTVNGNPSNTGQSDRPNVVGDWQLENPTVEQWFNTSAFVANDRYTYGNATRNLLRGPGTFNLDLALRKAFPISGRVRGEVRLESFNATNTPPLGNPNTQVGNPNFGRILTAGPARSNQVSMKVLF